MTDAPDRLQATIHIRLTPNLPVKRAYGSIAAHIHSLYYVLPIDKQNQ